MLLLNLFGQTQRLTRNPRTLVWGLFWPQEAGGRFRVILVPGSSLFQQHLGQIVSMFCFPSQSFAPSPSNPNRCALTHTAQLPKAKVRLESHGQRRATTPTAQQSQGPVVASLGLREAPFPHGAHPGRPPSLPADGALNPAMDMAFGVLVPAVMQHPLVGTVCELVTSFPWGRFY